MQEKEGTAEVLESLERSQKIKKLLVIAIIFVLLAIILFLGISAYFYFKTPEKTLGLGANIESSLLSEDGKISYIKLTGGINEGNITKIRFIFTDKEGNEYVYETSEGVKEIEVPFKRSFWQWLFGKPAFSGKYDYEINSEDIGLNDFNNINEISVVFEYKTETGEIIETPKLDTEKTTTAPTTTTGGGGGGGTGDEGTTPTPCSPNKDCSYYYNLNRCGAGLSDGCSASLNCLECPEGKICQDGSCILNCTNDPYCSSSGNFCDGNMPYTCVVGTDGCLDRMNETDCAINETCMSGSCLEIKQCTQDSNCTEYNRPEMASCNNTPDNNPFTWDYAPANSSTCNLITNRCTIPIQTLIHTCNISRCDAECETDSDCTNKCINNMYYYNAVCNNCNCSYLTEDCNLYDNWYDTGNTSWIVISIEECKEKEQKKQEYRNYSCIMIGCNFTVIGTRWIDTGNIRNKTAGTNCSLGVCDGNGSCIIEEVSNWPMFRGNPEHTGYSKSNAPDTNNLLWRFPINGTKAGMAAQSSPVVKDGVIYIGRAGGVTTGVIAINATSQEIIWSYVTGGASASVYSTPAIAYDRVYFGSTDYSVYSLNKTNGELIWRYPTERIIIGSPTVYDGKVYIPSFDGNLYALNAITNNPNGELIWKTKIAQTPHSTPGIKDDVACVGSGTPGTALANMSCLNALTGEILWYFEAPGGIYSSPAINDEIVYFNSDTGYAYAFDVTNGDLIWSYNIGPNAASPSVAFGRVFTLNDMSIARTQYGDRFVYSFDAANGTLLWRHNITKISSLDGKSNNPSSSPSVSADGKVCLGVDGRGAYWTGGYQNGSIICLNALTNNPDGELIWEYEVGAGVYVDTSPAIVDGVMYIAAGDGYLYAFGPEEGMGTLSPLARIWNFLKSLLTRKTGKAILTGKIITGNVVNKTNGNKKGESKVLYIFLSLLTVIILIIVIVIVKTRKRKLKTRKKKK